MSNLRESLSERNVDINKPTISQHMPQPFHSKISHNNKIKNKKVFSPSKKSPKHSSMSREKPQREEATTTLATITDPTINHVSTQYANMKLLPESDQPKLVNQDDNIVVSKRKNAKKKAKFKNLPMSMSNTNLQPIETIDNNTVQHNVASIQEYSANLTTLASAPSTSRFFENLVYHPQSQYLNNAQVMNMLQQSSSVPYSPVILHPSQSINPIVLSNAYFMRSELKCARYLQNAMQHPLLSKSFVQMTEDTMNVKTSMQKQTKGNRNKETNNAESKFEPYLSTEEVNLGLENKTLLQGVLRINPKQFQHAYISNTDRSEQDILIDGIKNRNRALEGDIVVVQLLEEIKCVLSEDDCQVIIQKKGKVVYIKEKLHNRTCIGNLKLMADKNRQKALFVPRDHRIPRLSIPFTSWPDNFYHEAKSYENTLFLAKIVDWSDTRFALGNIVTYIGKSGDMISETKAILAQTALDITPFGPEVRHLIPGHDYKIPDSDIKLREDCRKLCIFSIDPFNCRDIDDAMSCRELQNGNYEIGVHISDVAHYLVENTILDTKVADKATTIYMVERAYHMLPEELCIICSLFPGVDKLAFSVFWEITPNAVVLSHRFAKTVIHSCCQLAYEHAQIILEDKKDSEIKFPELYNDFKYEDVYKSIKTLGKIAAIFRKNRFDSGALRIDQPKVSFRLNGSTGLPESFKIYENKESHQLIEEFMLLANITVANRIQNDHPKLALLRCHPEPSIYMLSQLSKSLAPMGIDLKISTAGDLHHSLLPYNTDMGKAMVLNMLCAKPMARAKYFCVGSGNQDFHHYALNVPLYTHFTSPIRRYADIMVHRLLAASLNYRDVPEWDIDKVSMIAAQCNKQKFNAKKAGELSTELYMLKYIEMHSPVTTEAVVVDVRAKYIDIIIIAMGLNRRVHFPRGFPGSVSCDIIENEGGAKLAKMIIKWASHDSEPFEQVIEVFSIIKVEMSTGEEMTKIEVKVVQTV